MRALNLKTLDDGLMKFEIVNLKGAVSLNPARLKEMAHNKQLKHNILDNWVEHYRPEATTDK